MRCCIETGSQLYYVFKLILRDFGLGGMDTSSWLGKPSLTPSQPIETRHNTLPCDRRAWGYALSCLVLCATAALGWSWAHSSSGRCHSTREVGNRDPDIVLSFVKTQSAPG